MRSKTVLAFTALALLCAASITQARQAPPGHATLFDPVTVFTSTRPTAGDTTAYITGYKDAQPQNRLAIVLEYYNASTSSDSAAHAVIRYVKDYTSGSTIGVDFQTASYDSLRLAPKAVADTVGVLRYIRPVGDAVQVQIYTPGEAWVRLWYQWIAEQ